MSIFNGVYSLRKFVVFTVLAIFVLTLVSFLATKAMGILAGIGVIGLGIVLLHYILDQYGNYLLMDSGYYMSKEEMEEFGKKKLIKSPNIHKDH